MSDKPTTDTELAAGLRAFVTNVMARFESPQGVPLSPDEQAAFIRSVYWQAQNLRESEPFLRAEVEAAASAYVKEVARQDEACKTIATANEQTRLREIEDAITSRLTKRPMRKGKS